jgi:hypothetical protein
MLTLGMYLQQRRKAKAAAQAAAEEARKKIVYRPTAEEIDPSTAPYWREIAQRLGVVLCHPSILAEMRRKNIDIPAIEEACNALFRQVAVLRNRTAPLSGGRCWDRHAAPCWGLPRACRRSPAAPQRHT